MTLFDYTVLERSSNLLHQAQGAGLLLLGLAELLAFFRPSSRLPAAGPLALLLAGLAGLAIMVLVAGGGSPAGLAGAFAERGGFRIFLAFSLLYAAAGLSLLMNALLPRPAWRLPGPLLLAACGALYFIFPSRVSDAARDAVWLPHAAAGTALLAGAALLAASHFLARPAARAAAAGLLLTAGLTLSFYKEAPESFGPRRFVLEAGDRP
jgi:hypothetical protein